MTPTTQKFGWKDRDTTARDLLQLVYHAPEYISLRALALLQAIRSPAIVPELLEIFRDRERSQWERIYALRGVAVTPGNISLPELQAYLPVDDDNSTSFSAPFREDVLFFIQQHPSNQQWFTDYKNELFSALDTLPPAIRVEKLRNFGFIHREEKEILRSLQDRVMRLIEQFPELLDLDTVQWLRLDDDRDSTRLWLAARSDALIALSLKIDTESKPEELVYFLEHSDELREAVFHVHPHLISVYEQAKVKVDARRAGWLHSIDLMQSAIWRELSYLHRKAEAGDENAMWKLQSRTRVRDVLEQAAAVHFLGQLSQKPDFMSRMIYLLRYLSYRVWRHPNGESYRPALIEVGEVLRDHPSPEVWKVFIGTFFRDIDNESSTFLLDWIAYQTDVLSGLDVEYTGATLEVQDRPWFRALVERESLTQ
ncbi:MAG: hypothetical protein ABI835_18965 [Chloroflexota bacterium]